MTTNNPTSPREELARLLCRQSYGAKGYSQPRIGALVDEYWKSWTDEADEVLALLSRHPVKAASPEGEDEDLVLSVAKALRLEDLRQFSDTRPWNIEEVWATDAAMPLSGPGFVKKWTGLARAALAASALTSVRAEVVATLNLPPLKPDQADYLARMTRAEAFDPSVMIVGRTAPTEEDRLQSCYREIAPAPAPDQQAEPVAWRAKDFADGWILCHTEAQ